MNKKGFNPYKAFKLILRLISQTKPGDIGSLWILGISDEKDNWKENSQTQDLIELLKERGFHETNAPMFDKVSDKFRGDHDEMEFVTNNPNYLKFSHFDPFSFGETEPQSNLINIICKNKDKIIFIGWPHSFIKDIEFNPNAIIVDIWGIVEQKDYMNHKIIRSI